MLSVPSYPDPHDPSTPIAGAVARVTHREISDRDQSGRFLVGVFRSMAAAQAGGKPVDEFYVHLGDATSYVDNGKPVKPGRPAGLMGINRIPALADFKTAVHAAAKADPTLSPVEAIDHVIHTHLVNHHRLPGATLVTPKTQG